MGNRVLYSSICTGELYSYWACICLRSFKDLVSEPVTWEICTTEEWKDKLEEKLSDFKAEGFTFIFTIMSSVSDEVDITKYITLGWTPYNSADYFMWRVKHLDELKASHKWDTVITVDFDGIFLRSPIPLVQKFIGSGLTYAGAIEFHKIDNEFINKGRTISPIGAFKNKTYFNLGMGFLNLNKLPNNMWQMYKDMSKDKEDWFNTQDQFFFSQIVDESEKLILDDAQLVVHSVWVPEGRINRNPCLIHFSPKQSDMFKPFTSEHVNASHIVKLKYYKDFTQIAFKCSEYIPEEYLKIIKTNLTFVKIVFKIQKKLLEHFISFYKI